MCEILTVPRKRPRRLHQLQLEAMTKKKVKSVLEAWEEPIETTAFGHDLEEDEGRGTIATARRFPEAGIAIMEVFRDPWGVVDHNPPAVVITQARRRF